MPAPSPPGHSAHSHRPPPRRAHHPHPAGEIYNHASLASSFGISVHSGSDCEVLLPLWEALDGDPVAFARSLDGVFAITLVDEARGIMVVARDPYGVRPLFKAELPAAAAVDADATSSGSAPAVPGTAAGHRTLFASELKGIVPAISAAARNDARAWSVSPFPPGTVAVYSLHTGECLRTEKYHTTPWLKNPSLSTDNAATARQHVRVAFEAAVEKRLLSDRPVGCLLSGGLDSSLVAALAQRYLKARGKTLQTFSIGMAGSADLAYAAEVAAHIGSAHHEVLVSEDAFFSAIPAVVAAIESFDITSVRASVGNYLVSKYIAQHTDVKVVFNGDGSDEASGSYL